VAADVADKIEVHDALGKVPAAGVAHEPVVVPTGDDRPPLMDDGHVVIVAPLSAESRDHSVGEGLDGVRRHLVTGRAESAHSQG
jgi:hypothetical protein